MLKRNFLFLFLFLCVLYAIIFFIFSFGEDEKNIFFSYPKGDIYFAEEKVPISPDNYYNKQRFDKEFTISGNNLYQFYLYVKRYPLYIPYIEEQLLLNNIPNDFKYLPIAESALRNDVVSSAGAAGIWQFMPETAKQYGLRVDEFVDERYNFQKSTESAITYLQELYRQFGDWSLVAASYNRWENAIAKALKDQEVDNYYDLYLNEETSRYVFRIIAIKYLIEWYLKQKWLIDTFIGWVYHPPETKILSITQIPDILQWSKQEGYSYRDIKILNPWIIWNTLPEGEWEILVLK